MLADNPAVDLLEIEMLFREAASSAFLVADDDGFYVVIGIQKLETPNSIGSAGRRNRTGLCWRGIELRIDRVAARSTPVVCGSHRATVGRHHTSKIGTFRRLAFRTAFQFS